MYHWCLVYFETQANSMIYVVGSDRESEPEAAGRDNNLTNRKQTDEGKVQQGTG